MSNFPGLDALEKRIEALELNIQRPAIPRINSMEYGRENMLYNSTTMNYGVS